MRSMRLCVLVLGVIVAREPAEAAEPVSALSPQGTPSGPEARPPRRTIGRLGLGVQLGGFYDLADPGIEFRGWARRMGLSLSLGRHMPEPSEPDFTEVSSEPGKQFTGGVLFAFVDPQGAHKVAIKAYGTAGAVHVTQARARFERPAPTNSRGRGRNATEGEAVVEGQTGTGFFGGVGAEIGFAAVPGLAVGSELLFATGGDGWGPGVRFHLRYYAW